MSLPAAFVSVILIWSTTPLAIKWSAMGIGASFAVFARMSIGALLCLLLLATMRVRVPLHSRARQAYLAGGLSMFGAMELTYWSAQYISSGMISVLFGLSPLLTSFGAVLWLKEDALTPGKVGGMLLGFAGLLMVFRGGNGQSIASLHGMEAAFLAVLMQSLGLVWMKRINDDSPPLATTSGSLMVALPLFFFSWLMLDGHWPAVLPLRALVATIYLGAVGSVLGFALYFYMVKHMEAGRIALITLVTPVLALLLGHQLDREAVLPQVWLGTGSIVLGLCAHHWGEHGLEWLLVWVGKKRRSGP